MQRFASGNYRNRASISYAKQIVQKLGGPLETACWVCCSHRQRPQPRERKGRNPRAWWLQHS